MSTLEQILAAQTALIGELKSDLDDLMTREYGYTHDAIVTDDLEKDYQSIITETPSLADVSAVGMIAVLKNGDAVTAQGNRLFINGEEVVNPNGYTFGGTNSQNGIEIVKIWYFQNGSNQLTLQENFDYIIISANVKQIDAVNVNGSYLNYLNTITIDGNFLPPESSFIKSVIDNYGIESKLPSSTENYISLRNKLGGFMLENGLFRGGASTDKLKSAYLPHLTIISNCSFYRHPTIESVYCPTLKKIVNELNNSFYAPFARCPNLVFTIPESCTEITGMIFYESIKGIVMECKDAVISNSWCQALSSVSIYEMCSDWGASINITKPAGLSNWTNQKYIDLMNNKLRDMTLTNETRTLTIPSAKLTELQADTDGAAAIAAANAKGWTIGGA